MSERQIRAANPSPFGSMMRSADPARFVLSRAPRARQEQLGDEDFRRHDQGPPLPLPPISSCKTLWSDCLTHQSSVCLRRAHDSHPKQWRQKRLRYFSRKAKSRFDPTRVVGLFRMAAPYKQHGSNDTTRSLRVWTGCTGRE